MYRRSWQGRMFSTVLLLFSLLLAGCLSTFGPQAGNATISVTSYPEGAKVFLDGQDTGKTTPAVLENVKTGSRTLTVQLEGLVFEAKSITVRRSERVAIHFKGEVAQAPPPASNKARVFGFVNESNGGTALPDANVTAYIAGTQDAVATATSRRDGSYYLDLPGGTYDIVADKPGHAQAKRQTLIVEEGDTAEVNLVNKKLRDPSAGAPVAPSISVYLEVQDESGDVILTPFEPGTFIDYADTVFGLVLVDAAFDMYRIQLRIGHRDLSPDFQAGILSTELEFFLGDLLPPFGLVWDAPGETELIVTAYDYHENRTELVIPFTYTVTEADEESYIELHQVEEVSLVAVTYGQDLGLYRRGRAETFALFGIGEDPDLLDLGDGTFVDLSRLDKNVTMFTAVAWAPVFYERDGKWIEASGYEIERSFDGHRGWQRVGKTGGALFEQPYLDLSPALSPGKPVHYRVRAIGPHDEKGPWSDPVSVTPLDRLEVLLVDPADDANDVSLQPTLRWTHTDVGAQVYKFHGFVAGVTGEPGGMFGYYSWVFEDLVNETEVLYNYDGTGEPLKHAHTYQWNIVDAEASAVYGPNSVARAYAGTGLSQENGYAGAANGEFIFTTISDR